MNGRRAKALRKFAQRVGEGAGLPAVAYDVIEHVRTIWVLPEIPQEHEYCTLHGTERAPRRVQSFQIVVKDCIRRFYQYAKRHYKNAAST